MSFESKRAILAARAEAREVAREIDRDLSPEAVEAFVDGYLAALSRAAAPEPEWEYGYTSKWGICRRGNSLGVAKRDAADLRRGISEGRESGDLDYHGTLVRRARFAPGPWEPLPAGGENDAGRPAA